MHPLRSKVIVALDFEVPRQAYNLVEQLGEEIEYYKVGPQLFSQAGNESIRFLQDRGKKVFLDLKLYDTPTVMTKTIAQFAAMGVELVSVHCMGGRTMLEAAGSACRGSRLRLVGVTLLTSQGAPDSFHLGASETELDTVLRLSGIAMEARLAGVMCSPHELQALRPKTVPGFLLFTPGIRLEGVSVFQEDQQRVATPEQALAWGADMLIVGRPITQSGDPAKALRELFA